LTAAPAPRIEQVRAYLGKPDRTELDAGILVARLLSPDVDETGIRDTLSTLARRVADAEPDDGRSASATALADALSQAGFRGAQTDYYRLDNSRIDRVLEARLGIPITLALVYIEVGRRVGADVHGIGFPGHFLVEVDGTLVDPFNHRVLAEADFAAWVAERHPGASPANLRPRVGADEIALRMINNIKGIVLAQGGAADATEALDWVDCQLALGAPAAAMHLERSELWRRIGSLTGARAALTDALAACTDPVLSREIERRLSTLPIRGGQH